MINKEELAAQFKLATGYRDQNRHLEAIELLESLGRSACDSDIAAIQGTLAGVYWLMNDCYNSARCFSLVVERSPRSQLASIGLFHSHLGLNQYKKAIAEAQRYFAIVPRAADVRQERRTAYKEYKQALREAMQKDLSKGEEAP